jgi:hypothetical protein
MSDETSDNSDSPVSLDAFRKKKLLPPSSTPRVRLEDSTPKKSNRVRLGGTNSPTLPATNGETLAVLPPEKALALIRKWRKAGQVLHQDIYVTAELKEQVAMMAVSGASQDNIAKCLGISTPTLRKYFHDELECVPTVQNALVSSTALTMALSGTNTAATLFWLKARAGWRDQPDSPLPGNQGNVNVVIHIGGVDANL